jgi:selenocysteine-specific elongation factor
LLKQIILGTAGHIDHGKTSLIKAVTGIDTDRLKEEKLRGITIELGFASLELPSGLHLGIVDVPGHEKFVKNMVAGATGIDIVVMVIAADEGVMPQTREHMEICTLLDVKHGMVVLSKMDLVDEEWLELALEDVRDFTQGTFLDGAPIVPVSSTNGQGLEDFIKALDELSTQVPEKPPSSLFRLPIDRVFTMKGFGTVITGTLISGRVKVGEDIMIYPTGIVTKVRGIQVHNQSVTEAQAGMRTAINFQGLEKSAVNRGEILSSPEALKPSYMVDVLCHFLESNKKPLKSRTQVRFHTGTSEVLGNLILLDREELVPGDTTVAQIRLDVSVALVKDDRYVIRSYSPIRTIGGGQVLNPIPAKHKRFKSEIVQELTDLTVIESEEIISYHIRAHGDRGVSFSDLLIMSNITEKHLLNTMQGLLSKRIAILVDKENQIYIHAESFGKLKQAMFDHLENYHKSNPLKAGMSKEELKSKLPPAMGAKLFNLVFNHLSKNNEIIQEGQTVRLAKHKVSLQVDQADSRKKIMTAYTQNGLTPPYFKDLAQTLDMSTDQAKDMLKLLVDEKSLVKVKEDLYFHTEAVNTLKGKLVDFLIANEEITTPQLKEIAGVSRKYLIPLIEYFDAKNVTIRVGDVRKLRKG